VFASAWMAVVESSTTSSSSASGGLSDIYIKEYATVPALAAGLDDFFYRYNYERPHQSLGYAVPADVHFAVKVPIL
jgi:hypothetical protein